MAYIPKEVVAEIKKIDLLTYLKNYELNELICVGNGTYTTKTHDSIRISNGLWNWFSKGIGGKNALDYLIKVRGYTFKNAVEIILDNTKIKLPVKFESSTIKQEEHKLILPIKDDNCNKAMQYLLSRGIDRKIIENCIKLNLIYQEKIYNNVVFVGYDKDKNAKYAFCRATIKGKKFMREAKGSDKNYSFRLNTFNENKRLHLFESAIDLLSYATIMKLKNLDYLKENMLSVAGVHSTSVNKENIKIPSVIEKYLKENKNISEIYVHFDNDEVGRNATKNLELLLGENYKVINNPVPQGKDCNDYLCFLKEKIMKDNNAKSVLEI